MNGQFLVVGPNPATQKTLVFRSLSIGSVNRACEVRLAAGGKGIHAARALQQLAPGRVVVSYFAGGKTGDFLSKSLIEAGVEQLIGWHPGDSRTCTTLLCLETQGMTELIEPSPEVSVEIQEELISSIDERLAACAGLALCGTLPPGVGPCFYERIVRKAQEPIVVMDAWRDVEASLAVGNVDYLKINGEELAAMTGELDVAVGVTSVLDRFSLQGIMVTAGQEPAYCRVGEKAWRLTVPSLLGVRNTIGAGDTCTGVMLAGLVDGTDPIEAFRSGLAAASASCLHMEGARFTHADMEQIYENISIEELTVP